MPFANPVSSDQIPFSVPVRLRGLDTLRGLAAILVVLLHSGIPYMTNPLTYLVWPARDVHPSAVVDALTWCSECFLMPLFFVLAGFCAHRLLVTHGEGKFLEDRTKRVWLASFAAGLAILPICLCIWSLGWVAEGLFVPQDLLKTGFPPEIKAELFGVGHIWFLQNLYIYCLILCGISWLAKRFRNARQSSSMNEDEQFSLQGFDRLLLSPWKPLIPAIPCALILFWDPRIVLGFYQSFVPVLSKLIYYSVFFFMGAMLDRNRASLHLHARFGKTYLFIAALLFAFALPMIHNHLGQASSGPRLALLVSVLALFASFATFGLFAVFLRTRRGNNAVTQYLAESSYWVYLIHLPFVVLTQVAIAQLPLPTFGKFLLAGTTGLILSLMTYEVFARDTWLGEFLNGHRRPRRLVKDFSEPDCSSRESIGLTRPAFHQSSVSAHRITESSTTE